VTAVRNARTRQIALAHTSKDFQLNCPDHLYISRQGLKKTLNLFRKFIRRFDINLAGEIDQTSFDFADTVKQVLVPVSES
jgi:hypothetical protein